MFLFFGPEACGILLLHPEMEQAKKRWSLGNWNSAEKSELEIYYLELGESYKCGNQMYDQRQICHQERLWQWGKEAEPYFEK